MIKITIQGPVGSGKSRIISRLRDWLDEMRMTHMVKEESIDAAIDQHQPDVLIEEKVR